MAGGLIAFYQMGYGIAAFGVGPLEKLGGSGLERDLWGHSCDCIRDGRAILSRHTQVHGASVTFRFNYQTHKPETTL